MKELVLGNGDRIFTNRDKQYRIVKIGSVTSDNAIYATQDYPQDEVGNISTISEYFPGHQWQQIFAYDPQRQLISAEGPWGMENYFVDSSGNRDWMDWEDAAGTAKTFQYVYEPGTCADPEAGQKASNKLTCIIDPIFADDPEECEDVDPHPGHGKGHDKRIGRGHHTCDPYGPPGQTKKDKNGDGVPDDIDLSKLNIDIAGLIEELRALVNTLPTGVPGGMHIGWKQHFNRRYNSFLGRLTSILNRYKLHMRVLKRVFLMNENFHRLLSQFLDRRLINGPRWSEEEIVLVNRLLDSAEAVDARAGILGIAEEGQLLIPVTHDEAGNMTRKGDLCYDYYPDGRLRQVGLLKESDLPFIERTCVPENISPIMEFKYDAWGRRTSKTTYGMETFFAYDGTGKLISEALPEGTWTKEYYYLNGKPLAMWQGLQLSTGGCTPCAQGETAGSRKAAGFIFLLLLPVGVVLLVRRSRRRWLWVTLSGLGLLTIVITMGTCEGDCQPPGISADYYYYHLDHRGAPLFMNDGDGKLVWYAMYRPYGEAYVEEDPDGDGQYVVNNLRYPGQYEDVMEGVPGGERLYYNMMRYYDPSIGRYITVDPIAGSWPMYITYPYNYVANNPVLWIDPYGLDIIYSDNPWELVWELITVAGAERMDIGTAGLIEMFRTAGSDFNLEFEWRPGMKPGIEKTGGGFRVFIDPCESDEFPYHIQLWLELAHIIYSKVATGQWGPQTESDFPGIRAHYWAVELAGRRGIEQKMPYGPAYPSSRISPFYKLGKLEKTLLEFLARRIGGH